MWPFIMIKFPVWIHSLRYGPCILATACEGSIKGRKFTKDIKYRNLFMIMENNLNLKNTHQSLGRLAQRENAHFVDQQTLIFCALLLEIAHPQNCVVKHCQFCNLYSVFVFLLKKNVSIFLTKKYRGAQTLCKT